MREPEQIQPQGSVLPNYRLEEDTPEEPDRHLDDPGAETKLRAMRTISLSDCSIPE